MKEKQNFTALEVFHKNKKHKIFRFFPKLPYHTLFLKINFHRDLLNVLRESRTYFRSRLCGICKHTHALTL